MNELEKQRIASCREVGQFGHLMMSEWKQQQQVLAGVNEHRIIMICMLCGGEMKVTTMGDRRDALITRLCRGK